jgi:hypothetical protein
MKILSKSGSSKWIPARRPAARDPRPTPLFRWNARPETGNDSRFSFSRFLIQQGANPSTSEFTSATPGFFSKCTSFGTRGVVIFFSAGVITRDRGIVSSNRLRIRRSWDRVPVLTMYAFQYTVLDFF